MRRHVVLGLLLLCLATSSEQAIAETGPTSGATYQLPQGVVLKDHGGTLRSAHDVPLTIVVRTIDQPNHKAYRKKTKKQYARTIADGLVSAFPEHRLSESKTAKLESVPSLTFRLDKRDGTECIQIRMLLMRKNAISGMVVSPKRGKLRDQANAFIKSFAPSKGARSQSD